MRSKSGFTIIEVLIVTVIIALLATITIVAYTKVQSDARNNTRRGDATVIASALENYYNKNGEYPSVRSLVNSYPANTGTAVAATLGITTSDLKMPQMPSGSTNPLSAVTPPSNDYIAYVGSSSVNATDCQNNLTGGCDSFTLQYYPESGSLITITSRHSGRSSNFGTIPDAVAAPTLVATTSGANVIATATAAACESGLTAKYSFQYRENGGSWAPYSTWSTSAIFSQVGDQGAAYDFQAVTRCDNSSTPGQSSPVSNIASVTATVTAPSAPVITVTKSGTNVLATITPVTCTSPATAQYAIRSRTNGGTWSSYSSWSTTLTTTQAGTQGALYGYQAEARCTANGQLSTAAVGTEATFVYPITAPTMPAITVSTTGLVTTWSWTAVTCPAGTTAQYQENDSMDGTSAYSSGWFGPYSPTTSNWTTDSQGYQFTESFQAQCFNGNGASPWSNTTSGNYIRAVTAPGAPISFVGSEPSNKKEIDWNWAYPNAPGCQSGLQYQDERSATFTPPTGLGTFGAQGWFAPTWSQIIAGTGGAATVIPAGDKFQMNAKYVCVNTDTGRQSAFGPIGTSPIFTSS